jgi:hypothetical protein
MTLKGLSDRMRDCFVAGEIRRNKDRTGGGTLCSKRRHYRSQPASPRCVGGCANARYYYEREAKLSMRLAETKVLT